MLASTHVDRSERLETGKRIFTDTIHMKPIASYKNGSLRRDPGVLSATGDDAWPLAVDGICDVRVAPRIAGKSPLLHMGHGKDFVRFSLVGANNVSGVSKGNVTTFPNAWNNADLRYTYAGFKLQEEIILRTGHPKSFGFIVQEHTGFDPKTLSFGSFRIQQPTLEKGDVTVPLSWLVTQSGGKWVLTVTLPAGDWAGWTVDPTLSLQPAAADGMDTWFRDTHATTNYGTNDSLAGGNTTAANNDIRRSLLAFDLSSIPADAVVSAATLSLWLQYAGNSFATSNNTLSLYRVLRNWVEAQATWNVYSTGNNWDTAGCGNTTTDREAASVGSHGMLLTDAANSQQDFALTAGAGGVQDWFAGTLANYGLLLKGGTEADDMYVFDSSDYATAAYRPKLVVDYTLPGGGGIFGSSIFHSAIMGGTITR